MANINYFELLVDPYTKEKLNLEISEQQNGIVLSGLLKSSNSSYPIINGIPRFVKMDGGYSANFGYQWHKWSLVQFESHNLGLPMEGHTAKMFQKIGDFNKADFENKLILDLGCGAGRFIELARKAGATVIGIDYSNAADVSRKNHNGDAQVFIVQGDALNLPFAANSFDGIYSIGVLHHTPDPFRGIEEGSKVLKEKGWFALAVYEKGKYYGFSIIHMWRNFFNKLRPYFKDKPAIAYTYIIIYLVKIGGLGIHKLSKGVSGIVTKIFPHVWLPDINWSLLDTFDSITTSYQSTHTNEEAKNWFTKLKYSSIKLTGWGVSLKATK